MSDIQQVIQDALREKSQREEERRLRIKEQQEEILKHNALLEESINKTGLKLLNLMQQELTSAGIDSEIGNGGDPPAVRHSLIIQSDGRTHRYSMEVKNLDTIKGIIYITSPHGKNKTWEKLEEEALRTDLINFIKKSLS